MSLISLHSYSSGENFSSVPVKYEYFIYINPPSPYRNAMDTVYYNIHTVLVFREAEGG
jgi:hypothetical protein